MTAQHHALGFAANLATLPTPKSSRSLPIMLAVGLFCCWSGLPVRAIDALPVATIGTVTNAVPGAAYSVPVTFSNFNNLGSLRLTIRYDINKLTFESVALNPALTGMTVTNVAVTGTQFRNLIFMWSSATNFSLPDGSSLANLTFSYITSSGLLYWNTNPTANNRYKRWVGTTLTTLIDGSLFYLFYVHGGIAGRGAPVTIAPVIANPAVGALSIPITVRGFFDITTISLNLEYDPTVITYQGTFTKNEALGESFACGDTPSPENAGKRCVTIALTELFPVAVPDGNTLCTLDFTYLAAGAFSTLTWFDNNGSCEYQDHELVTLIDHPQATYFHNGGVGLPPVSNLQITNTAPGFATISWTPRDFGLVLQETLDLSPPNWNNAPSGPTNPVTVPINGPARFYRLLQTGP